MWVLAALGTPLGGGVGEGKWEGKALWNFPRTEYSPMVPLLPFHQREALRGDAQLNTKKIPRHA